MKEKAPAYQWYPKDILTDKRVIRMDLATEAVYRRLLDFAWLENGLDDDMFLLSDHAKMRGQISKFKKFWKEIKPCFHKDDRGRWRNPKQEKYRLQLKERSDKQRQNAQKRWGANEDATASILHPVGNALHLQSSSSSATPLKDRSKADAFSENFNEKQMHDLKAVVAEVMGHSIMSEANTESTRHVIAQAKKAHKKKPLDNPFAYSITIARNLKNGKNSFSRVA